MQQHIAKGGGALRGSSVVLTARQHQPAAVIRNTNWPSLVAARESFLAFFTFLPALICNSSTHSFATTYVTATKRRSSRVQREQLKKKQKQKQRKSRNSIVLFRVTSQQQPCRPKSPPSRHQRSSPACSSRPKLSLRTVGALACSGLPKILRYMLTSLIAF